jgi:hypothetical protein
MRKHWKAPAGRRSDRLRGRGLIVAIAAPAMLAVAAFAGIALAGSANAATTRNFYVTLYGWPDNSPALPRLRPQRLVDNAGHEVHAHHLRQP